MRGRVAARRGAGLTRGPLDPGRDDALGSTPDRTLDRARDRGQPAGGPSVDALVRRLSRADTPYQAWTALALLGSDDARRRAAGRDLATRLTEGHPPTTDHADVAAGAALAGHGLTREVRAAVAAALPPPHLDPVRRSRFYAAPAYAYLAARGLGGALPRRADVSHVVLQEAARAAAQPSPDLADLVLRLATLLVLGPAPGVAAGDAALGAEVLGGGTPGAATAEATMTDATTTDVVRRLHGHLVAAPGDADAAVACRWLLELYADRLDDGPAGADAHAALERYAAAHWPEDPDVDALRPEVAAMLLEATARRAPRYELAPARARARDVARHLGRRRFLDLVAYPALAVIAAAAPLAALVNAGRLPTGVALAAAAAVAPLGVLWVVLWLLRRPRSVEGFGAGAAFGGTYYAAAVYEAWHHTDAVADKLVSEGVLTAVGAGVVVGFFTAWQAARGGTPE